MKKTCMKCGGNMSKGGKVAPIKMSNGGIFSTLGSKIGVGVNAAGMLGTGVKMIVDKIKEKRAKKKGTSPDTMYTNTTQGELPAQRRGGYMALGGTIGDAPIKKDRMMKGGQLRRDYTRRKQG